LNTTLPNILAEQDLGFGRAQLIEWRWPTPLDVTACEESHAVELSLPPFSTDATASFPLLEADGSHFVGSLFYRPAGVTIRARSIGGRTRVVRVVAAPGDIAAYVSPDRRWAIGELQACMNIKVKRMRELLALIHKELVTPGLGAAELSAAYGKALLIELTRFLETPHVAGPESRLAAWQYRRICERLEQDGAPPTAHELAALCNLSPRHLLRQFRNLTGDSVIAYIQKAQVRRGQLMLVGESVALKEIAARLGYADTSAFTKAFRRHTGESPGSFRRRWRGMTENLLA